MTIFERYGEISGAPGPFRDAATSPLPMTVWINPPLWPSVRDLLDGLGAVLTPISWLRGAFRVADPSDPTFLIARLLGALHIQEEAAMMPVLMLDPGRDERILDTCAAPGNKTAALAVRLGSSAPGAGAGRVVAVDISEARMGVLRTTLNTLGICNVAGLQADASDLSERFGLFDAAMVDVPCSCEGTSRKHSDVIGCISPEARSALAAGQTRLLRSAIRRVRPGGRIVYATCTYAPEENEAVVANVVEEPEPGQEVRVAPFRITGLATSPGVASWQGRAYPKEVENALRLWPHRSDTGGFFAALLEKAGPGTGSGVESRVGSANDPASDPDSDPAGSGHAVALTGRPIRIDERPWSAYTFDVLATNGLVDLRTGSKYSSIVSESLAGDPALALPDTSGATLLFTGMRGLNLKSGSPRMSTSTAIRFGARAGRGLIEIRPKHVRAWLRRETVPAVRNIPPDEPAPVAIVRSEGCPLGLGRIDPRTPDTVTSLFPKVHAGIEVRETLPP